MSVKIGCKKNHIPPGLDLRPADGGLDSSMMQLQQLQQQK